MNAARLLPQDPALPHLARLFDTAHIGRRLQSLFTGNDAHAPAVVIECDIERVKYRPRRSCVVAYKLQLRDANSGAPREQRLALCMYGAEDARTRYDTARRRDESTARRRDDGASVSLLDDLHALAGAFPHDRKLPHLALIADGERVAAECLPGLIRMRWGSTSHAQDVQHTIVSYFPEHACTVTDEITLSPVYGDTGQRVWKLFGKMRADYAGARTYANMQALWHSEARRRGQIAYAYPLAYDAAHRLLWQEAVAATTLEELLDDAGVESLAQVGAAIAALHTTPVADAPTLGGADVSQQLQRAHEVITLALGERSVVAVASARLVADLARAWWHIDFAANATLHGDLHSNNILIGAAGPALIDFDALTRGPALAELGSFLAELIYRACVGEREVPIHKLNAILDAYRRAVPWLVPADQLAWFTAAALIHERAYRCVTSLKPGRLQALPRLLEVAEQILSGQIRLQAAPLAPPRRTVSPMGAQA